MNKNETEYWFQKIKFEIVFYNESLYRVLKVERVKSLNVFLKSYLGTYLVPCVQI
jgi:hypothetical protein